jgi:hypothetical protein
LIWVNEEEDGVVTPERLPLPQPDRPVNPLGCWRVSGDVCAFADSERHLGHVLKVESLWIAFDGTHLAESGMGFRIIGTFSDLASAKTAVEFATLFTTALTHGAAGSN